MSLKNSTTLASILVLLTSGCLSPIDPTPRQTTAYNQSNPNSVKTVFTNLYHRGHYLHANTLMCEPDTENLLYREAEAFYKKTIGTPESIIVRMKMAQMPEFDYFDDTKSNIENQILKIRQHYYFKYYAMSEKSNPGEIVVDVVQSTDKYCIKIYRSAR